jgi:sensor histidine kinase YesM
MKRLLKSIFPALYGLLVYFTIRLLHDFAVDSQFWKRDWTLNIFEMSCSVLTGYLSVNLFNWLFRCYDRRWALQLKYQRVVKELVILVIANLILVGLVFFPMAAFADDGLSWGDVVDLTTIPALYAIIYYGITRSSTWFNAYVNNKIQLEKITNEHLEAELKFLKAQYHPHFLFNALNAIYFQMDEDPPGAKKSMEKFSDLLRYQLYDQQHKVPIHQEITYLQSFVDLHKIRSSDKLQLKVFFDPQLNEQQIYPLLFLPLVENAFKFVGGNYQLSVDCRLSNELITFKVENGIPLTKRRANKASGIGLENLKRRLDLIYPGCYELKLQSDDKFFTAELNIIYEH